MHKKISLLLVLCLIISALSVNVSAVGNEGNVSLTAVADNGLEYYTNEVIVLTDYYVDPADFTSGTSIEFHGVQITGAVPLFPASTQEEVDAWVDIVGDLYLYLVTLDSSWNVLDAIEKLETANGILSAGLNHILPSSNESTTVESASAIANSTLATTTTDSTNTYSQWAHTYLNISSVWEKGFVGSDAVHIVVLDNGCASHEDLQDNLSFTYSYDVVNGINDYTVDDAHGNACAGIIGADCDDIGINGICQNVTITPIRINTEEAIMYMGIARAITVGADIINISVPMVYELTDRITNIVENSDVLVITPSGNMGGDMLDDPNVEAMRNDCENWIVVGAIDQNENLSVFNEGEGGSSYSSEYCDLMAPGSDIFTTGLTNTDTSVSEYLNLSGTSFAAPHVTAACALIMSHATHLTPLQVKQLVMDNVKPLEGFDEYCVSGGALSILNMIEELYTEYRGEYTKGDSNGDGYVTLDDAELCRTFLLGHNIPTSVQTSASDVDNNNELDAEDYLLTKRFCSQYFYFPPC